MDTATRIRYLETRIAYGEDLLNLVRQRNQDDLLQDISEQLRALKREEQRLNNIHTPSEYLAVVEKESRSPVPWMLEEWRRVSIPRWQRILRQSIEQPNAHREEYARWMLREVLLDPEYDER